jgi:hypothetical protein
MDTRQSGFEYMSHSNTLGRVAYEAAAMVTGCDQPWDQANQAKWLNMIFDFIGIRAAERIVRDQFNIVDDPELEDFRASLPSIEAKRTWDKLVDDIRGKDDAPLRVGHVFWMFGVIEGDHPEKPTLKLTLPADSAYAVTTDAGIGNFRRFMLSKVDGNLIEAYDRLRAGAERKSPLCMNAYGAALLRGDVPGKDPDPTAVVWLEKAARRTGNAVGTHELAMALLEGKYVGKNVEKGMRLLEQISCRNSIAAWDIAEILFRGLYGIPQDTGRALTVVHSQLPGWRRTLSGIGIGQHRWLDRMLCLRASIKGKVEEQTYRERQTFMQDMVSGLRR